MPKYFVFLLLNLGAIFNTIATPTTGKSHPYAVYPLILFETSDNALRRPFSLDAKQYFLFLFKTYNFGAAHSKKQLLFCPATTQNKREISTAQESARHSSAVSDVVNDYCLFERTESPLLSLFNGFKTEVPRCITEPEPFISKIFPDKNAEETNQEDGNFVHEAVDCGPEGKGKLYRYGYRIWLRKGLLDRVQDNLDPGLTKSKAYPYKDIIDYEIYRFCYNAEEDQVLYTKHRIISPKLLLHIKHGLKRETSKHYDISSENFDLKGLNFEARANKYSQYVERQETEKSNASSPKYKLDQLVPASDFSLALWRKPTFHYVNVELIREELFDLWNHILKSVQKQVRGSGVEFDVYTKAFNMPKESNENSNNFKIEEVSDAVSESPQIWIKIIHQYSETEISGVNLSLAIIANNELSEKLNETISNTFCHINYCKTIDDFSNDTYPNVQQYVKCCAVNEEIKKLFNLDPSLNIEGTNGRTVFVEGFIADLNPNEKKSTES